MKKQYRITISNNIRNFIISSTKLLLIPTNNFIGYNHLIRAGASKKPITSDMAHYLLLSDLNTICCVLDKYLKVELTENKLCALVSYLHSKNILPSELLLHDINASNFKLAGERLFLDPREQRTHRALRSLQYKLWNSDSLDMINYKLSDSIVF